MMASLRRSATSGNATRLSSGFRSRNRIFAAACKSSSDRLAPAWPGREPIGSGAFEGADAERVLKDLLAIFRVRLLRVSPLFVLGGLWRTLPA